MNRSLSLNAEAIRIRQELKILDVLKSGDEERILRIGESDVCAVVDWRNRPEEVMEILGEFLPTGYLTWELEHEDKIRVMAGGRPPVAISWTSKKFEACLDAVNRALAPDFEMRQFRPCEGDGYSLLIETSAWWLDVTVREPDLIERYFLPLDRLAAYWGKSYFLRLISKP